MGVGGPCSGVPDGGSLGFRVPILLGGAKEPGIVYINIVRGVKSPGISNTIGGLGYIRISLNV